jgi:hypothetical protein
MRIIGNIEHPTLKISVFKNDNRISVKLENSGYEVIFKLGDDDRLKSVEEVSRLIDAAFIGAVQTQLQNMHATRLAAMARLFPLVAENEFETII